MADKHRDVGPAVKQVWSASRYPSLAPNLLPAVARLVTTADINPGDRVLDVGCGTGNVSITASRDGATVVGLDVTRAMLDHARTNTRVADLDPIDWVEGDAQTLPFADDCFAVTLSNFGHVFAPDPQQAPTELLRVTEPGGCVAYTAWSPDGLVGKLTDVLTDHLGPDASGSRRHLEWGDSTHVRNHLPESYHLSFQRRSIPFRYVSPEHFWDAFAEQSGPLSPVVATLEDPDRKQRIRRDALEYLNEWFVDNAVRVEYLLVHVTLPE